MKDYAGLLAKVLKHTTEEALERQLIAQHSAFSQYDLTRDMIYKTAEHINRLEKACNDIDRPVDMNKKYKDLEAHMIWHGTKYVDDKKILANR